MPGCRVSVLLTNSEISIFRREYGTIKEKTGVKCMLKRDGGKQLKMTFLTLEDLIPEKHFLRDLERCVDFSFIYDIVEPLYARIGRIRNRCLLNRCCRFLFSPRFCGNASHLRAPLSVFRPIGPAGPEYPPFRA